LNEKAVKDASGKYDESKVTIEKYPEMYVFGVEGEKLPDSAIRSFEKLEKVFNEAVVK
jgi:hypothetical protein